MTTVSAAQAAKLFKNACRLHLQFPIMRYLISNTDGRLDGAEKALRHLEMSYFYVAAIKGVDTETVRLDHHDEYMAVHDTTQELTDNLDEAIGFPLRGRPDYDDLAPKFFEQFHALAMKALGIPEVAGMALLPEGELQ